MCSNRWCENFDFEFAGFFGRSLKLMHQLCALTIMSFAKGF